MSNAQCVMRNDKAKLESLINDKKIFEAVDACGIFELAGAEVDAEEIPTAGNSFFDKNYFGTRILILAPHPDDEINIAGNMILTLAAAKAEIFVAYSTDGGLEVPPEIRAQEAVDALKILGVPKDKIIFMNYKDGQKLSADARKNFKRDLKNLLLELRANIIFCVDLDSHPDHKNLSICFEEVLGEILSERNDYRPEVYKKLAYATAFTAVPDFYALNLLETKNPKIDLIDRANYIWENRVRFPVMNYQTILKDNPIAEAIFAHKSQRNQWNALRILNSDEIFFERRTDSQTFSAKISATSGDASKVRDFKIFSDDDYLWRGDKIFFNWDEPAQVQRIVIYGNALDDSTKKISLRLELAAAQAVIDKAGISLDNVKNFSADLPARGRPLIIDTEKFFVTRAEIAGKNLELAEVEFFANVEPLHKIPPFIKLTVDDNFFYRYAVPAEVDKISVGVYRFHVDAPIKITATAGDENILSEVVEDGELILNFGKVTEIVLTAEVVGSDIYDRAIIRRVGDFAQIQLKIWQWLDKLRVHKIRKVDS